MLICKQPNKNKKEMKTRVLEEKLAVLSETPQNSSGNSFTKTTCIINQSL